jgi:hypothetical protein
MIFHAAETTSKFLESLPQPRFNSGLERLSFRVSCVGIAAIVSVGLITSYPLILSILVSTAVVIAGDCIAYLIHSKNTKEEIIETPSFKEPELIKEPSHLEVLESKIKEIRSFKREIRIYKRETRSFKVFKTSEGLEEFFPSFNSEEKKILQEFKLNISVLYNDSVNNFFQITIDKIMNERKIYRFYTCDFNSGVILAVLRLHQKNILTESSIKALSELSGDNIYVVSRAILKLYNTGILTQKYFKALMTEAGQYAKVIINTILCLHQANLLKEGDLETEENLKAIVASKENAYQVGSEIVALHQAGILNADTRQILLSKGGEEAYDLSYQIQTLHRRGILNLENQKAFLAHDGEHALSISYAIETLHAQEGLSADEIQIIRDMIIAAKENACVAVFVFLTLHEAGLLLGNQKALSADDRMREDQIWRCVRELKDRNALKQENLNLLIQAKRCYIKSVCQGVSCLCRHEALDDPENGKALLTGGGEHAKSISNGIVNLHEVKLLKPEYREVLLIENGKHAEVIAKVMMRLNEAKILSPENLQAMIKILKTSNNLGRKDFDALFARSPEDISSICSALMVVERYQPITDKIFERFIDGGRERAEEIKNEIIEANRERDLV